MPKAQGLNSWIRLFCERGKREEKEEFDDTRCGNPILLREQNLTTALGVDNKHVIVVVVDFSHKAEAWAIHKQKCEASTYIAIR